MALALEYRDTAAADRFVRAYRSALSTCTPTPAPTGSLLVSVLTTPAGAVLLTRQRDPFEGTTWTELVTASGPVVTIVGVDVGSGAAPPRWSDLARALA